MYMYVLKITFIILILFKERRQYRELIAILILTFV